jgi:DNA-binding winged helix-turn-helix (wHTH) protein/tetratricopeptide (TPR) repeat protein
MTDELEFGEWRASPHRNLLWFGQQEHRIQPRIMDLLVYLGARPGQVVTKAELAREVWQAQHIGDDVLTVAVYSLRKTLGDTVRHPSFIETVPKRGYRWVGPALVHRPPRARASLPAPRMIAAAVLVIAASGLVVWGAADGGSRRHVVSPESNEAYVKGRYFLDQRVVRGWQDARAQFERALALDPANAAAHAALSDTYSAMADFGAAMPAELRAGAMAEARRAIALDPRAAEGHAALARAQLFFDWDLAAAERSLRAAFRRDSTYMPAYQTRAWLETARGRFDDAARAGRRAVVLDPANAARYTELAWVLGLDGRYDEALDVLDRAMELDQRTFEVLMARAMVFERRGNADSSFANYLGALRVAGLPESALRRRAAEYRAAGLASVFRSALAAPGSAVPMSETWRAQMLARLGETDRAIEALERAAAKREGALVWLRVEPSFRPLREDARFRRIAALVGG